MRHFDDLVTTDEAEALLRAATYLKWFRDGAITPTVRPPQDLNDIIAVLERLAAQGKQPPRAGRLVVEETQEEIDP
jgi:hypothetical protein